MTTQRVTIELTEPVFRELTRIAEATQQSVEVLAGTSESILLVSNCIKKLCHRLKLGRH